MPGLILNPEDTLTGIILGVTALTFWGFISVAQAADLTVYTQMEAQEEYSSNIYLSERSEADDFTSRFSPSFDLSWSTPKSHLDMDYKLSILEYNFTNDTEFRGRNDDYIIWHELELEAGVFSRAFFGKRLYFEINQDFFQNDDPHRVERGFLVGRNEYYVNRTSPEVHYIWGDKLLLKFKYIYERLEYQLADIEDSDEHRGVVSIQYKLNSKNSLAAEYQYAGRYFDISQNYRLHQSWLKVHHIFNSYLKADLGGGYQDRNYVKGIIDDWQGFTGLAGLEATTGNKLNSRLTYQYMPSTIGTFVFFNIHRLDLRLEYYLLPSLRLIVDQYVQWDYYRQPKGRHERLIGWGSRLRFAFIKDWYIEAGYYRHERRSNFSGNSYHEGGFSLALSMDYGVI